MPTPLFTWLAELQKKWTAEKLLADFPGLEGQDPEVLGRIAKDAYQRTVGGWAYIGFSVIVYFPALALTVMLFNTLSAWFEVPFLLVAVLAMFPSTYLVSRMRFARTHRITTQLIAAAYPDLYCPCGYCLRGHPDASRCPECGNERQPTPPSA